MGIKFVGCFSEAASVCRKASVISPEPLIVLAFGDHSQGSSEPSFQGSGPRFLHLQKETAILREVRAAQDRRGKPAPAPCSLQGHKGLGGDSGGPAGGEGWAFLPGQVR